AAGFMAMAVAMLMVRFPAVERSKGATVLHDIVDGLVFTYRNRIFFILLLMGFVIGYFGLSYMWLLPAFAVEYLGDESGVALGWLMAANGAGGMVGVLGVASFGGYQNRSWLLIGGGISFGIAVLLFGLTAPWGLFVLAAFFGAAAGALHSLFQTASSTVVNLLVPNDYRGRVLGVRGIMWSLAPLGALHAGLIATWVNLPFSIALGGIVVIACSVAALVLSKDVRNLRQLVERADAGHWARPDAPAGRV
ncbi:MAG: MFS transporter, partial [Dehalococcoidia bacterium]